METKRNDKLASLAVDTAQKMINLPYRWGGNNPMNGFDCSGLVVEVFKGIGLLPHRGDWGAASLSAKWPKTTEPKPGCLVFFGAGKVTHVGIVEAVFDDRVIMIEAGGGGSSTKTLADAANQDAYVMRRPVDRRKDVLFYTDPFAEV